MCSTCYFLGGISILVRRQNLKELTVYLELVEQVCWWSHTLLASWRPGSLCPGELSQLINILYQILGGCQPVFWKGSVATLLLSCLISTSSTYWAGEAWVSTFLKPRWDLGSSKWKRPIHSPVEGWDSPLKYIPNSQDNLTSCFYIPLANKAEKELAHIRWKEAQRSLNTTTV